MIGVLIDKELAGATGSPRAARGRMLLLAGVALVLLGGMSGLRLDGADLAAVPRWGRSMFSWIAWLQTLAMLFVGPAMTLGSVSGERRRGTLGVLTLAGFSPPAVVVGKCAAHFAATALLLLTTVPVVIFLGAYGGVDPEETAAVYATGLCAAAWGCALGTLLSALLDEGTGAMVVALTAIALCFGIPLALARGAAWGAATTWWGPLAVLHHVLSRNALADGVGRFRLAWIDSSLWTLAQAGGFLALGALALRRLPARGLPVADLLARLAALVDRFVPRFVPTSERILSVEAEDADFNPFAWREAYGRSLLGLRAIAGLAGAATMALLASYVLFGSRLDDYEFLATVLLILVLTPVLIASALSSAAIAAEKEDKTLETVALLEVMPWRYVHGKFYGLLWTCLPPCLPPLVHAVVFWVAGRFSLLVPLAVAICLPMAIACAIAHGLWVSLRCASVGRAVAAGVLAQIAATTLQFGAGFVCCLLFLVNPLYLIAWTLAIGPLRGSLWEHALALAGAAVLAGAAYWVNLRYVSWLLWRIAGDFPDRVAAYLEGRGGR